MNHELHITRGAFWVDPLTAGITLQEWRNYIKTDEELEMSNGYNYKIGSVGYFQNKEGYCEWNAHPIIKETNYRPWFAYVQGIVEAKNPDAFTIRKMIKIAAALHAQVQANDGTLYTQESLGAMQSSELQNTSATHHTNKPKWKKVTNYLFRKINFSGRLKST